LPEYVVSTSWFLSDVEVPFSFRLRSTTGFQMNYCRSLSVAEVPEYEVPFSFRLRSTTGFQMNYCRSLSVAEVRFDFAQRPVFK
jgi:hypothetical protein